MKSAMAALMVRFSRALESVMPIWQEGEEKDEQDYSDWKAD